MLTITRGLTFKATHTVYDSVGGPLSDLTDFTIKSQIRESTAVKKDGYFQFPFVIDVTVTKTGVTDSQYILSLTKAETESLPIGDYLIDVVGTKDGNDEFLLNKEPIKVVGFITLPEDPDDVPDFVAIFNAALTT